jgi:hypothetical protein
MTWCYVNGQSNRLCSTCCEPITQRHEVRNDLGQCNCNLLTSAFAHLGPVTVEEIDADEEVVTISARTTTPYAACPGCGKCRVGAMAGTGGGWPTPSGE